MSTPTFEELLSRYAILLIRHGLNVQPGQIVNIGAEACHRDLAYKIAEEAYKVKAKYVNIDLIEPRLGRLRVLHSSLDDMNYVPSYLESKYGELVDTSAANLRLVGPEDPDLLVGLDQKKLNTGRVSSYKAIKRFYEEGIGKSKVHWTVAAAATPGWGKRVFPNLSPQAAEQALWDQIFKISRVDRTDFLEEWERHNSMLQKRATKLTALKIEHLHFHGPGTNLKVGLSERAIFKGGSDISPRGAAFEPNIPTEECFTTPDYRVTEGVVRTTRPFFINGTLVKGLELEFKNGEIVKFKAQSGEDTFREYSGSDPGGKRLGEVALVGIDSPVYKSGLVFEEILFDENAACHIAIGSAYKFCLKDGDTLGQSELQAVGCNESSVHTDMMISSEEVDVVAQTRSGDKIPLIKRGEWCNF